MTRRQLRLILAGVAAAAGLSLVLVAPMVNALTADASALVSGSGPSLVPPTGTKGGTSDGYSGYYENVVGPLTFSSSVTVAAVKCTNSGTWNTHARLLGVLDSQTGSSGNGEHGGGVQVGCTKTGSPVYTALLCDPSLSADPSFLSGCDSLSSTADPVAPGDVVTVNVTAGGGCQPTCSSVTTTVNDSTEHWSATPVTSAANSDFDAFVAVVGTAPLVDFGKVTVSGLSMSGTSFAGQKANLVDLSGRTLARAGRMNRSGSSFTLKWVRAS
jgi:hypothetical protein